MKVTVINVMSAYLDDHHDEGDNYHFKFYLTNDMKVIILITMITDSVQCSYMAGSTTNP